MKLHNTLTGKLEAVDLNSELKMFVCGPTVYAYPQLGNAKTFTQFDVLARVLRASGAKLTYLQNITDIDDKIIARAARNKEEVNVLTARFEQAFYEDMDWLNNTSVDTYARATDFIPQIISQVKRLVDKGYAYEISDGIYFEIAKYRDYGKLSGRREVEQDDAQSRVDQSEEKKGWNDFCLWKFSKSGEPTWEAPFGPGRPGWHIEDTAITEHFFGPQYDIHGGAIDLIFPHHEAELTQMESISGLEPFVKHWVHSSFLKVSGRRMGKSEGNFVTIKQLREQDINPLSLRLMFLQAHYRTPQEFSQKLLEAAAARLQRWENTASLQWQPVEKAEPIEEAISLAKGNVLSHLQNDMQTPQSISEIEKLFKQIEQGMPQESIKAFADFLKWLDGLFGFNLAGVEDITPQQKTIIEEYAKARTATDYARSDTLRTSLQEKHGLLISDTPAGPRWQRTQQTGA